MTTPLRRYYRGYDLAAIRDAPAATTRYVHLDGQGTVQCLTDSTGAVTDRFASDAWGNQVKRTGTSINRQWYVGNWGYYRQVDRMLDYVRARTIQLATARWLARDRIRREHPYIYSANNPVRGIDPSGHFCGVTNRPCGGPQGWQFGEFRFCPALFDPKTEWAQRKPTLRQLLMCQNWAWEGEAFALLHRYWNFWKIIGHWEDNEGIEWNWSRDIVERLLARAPKDRDFCNSFAFGAATFAEANLPCDGKFRKIWLNQETKSGLGESDDGDLYWAIGGHRVWSHAEVTCFCYKGKDYFIMDPFTFRLTDQQLGRDTDGHFTYLCHRLGIYQDFVTCGSTKRFFSWFRGEFIASYPDPCKK